MTNTVNQFADWMLNATLSAVGLLCIICIGALIGGAINDWIRKLKEKQWKN